MKCPRCHSTNISIRKLTAIRKNKETNISVILRCLSNKCGTFTFLGHVTDAEISCQDQDASAAVGVLGADEPYQWKVQPDDQHKCPRCGKLTVGTYWNGIQHRWCRDCAEDIL